MTFANAIKATQYNETSLTDNGALTNASTSNALVDLFSLIGSNVRSNDLEVVFEKAYVEDSRMALKILLWARDIREGAGRRENFRKIMKYIEKFHNTDSDVINVLNVIPEFGRYDDLLIFETDKFKNVAFANYKNALINGDSLAAKWAPRKGAVSVELRNFLGYSPKRYRKTIVNLTKVVESQMCSKKFDAIEYDKVPSVASTRYAKAFRKHSPVKYQGYLDSLIKGEAKANVGAVYPMDVLRNIHSEPDLVRGQWGSLPNYLGDNKIFPMIDVSGSMSFAIQGSLTALHAAVSIGLYVADKQSGDFKDMCLTFSSNPKIEILKGDIISKYNQMNRAHWDMSTNVEAGFREILKVAIQNNVAPEDMPKSLMIISDMEFNQCTGGTAYNTVAKLYKNAGYVLPRVIFWNMNGRTGNAPVKFNTNGTALISGYSTAILKSILSDKLDTFTPQSVMFETINKPRYEIWG